MNQDPDLDPSFRPSDVAVRRASRPSSERATPGIHNFTPAGEYRPNGDGKINASDLCSLIETLGRRWFVLFLGGAALAVAGYLAGARIWHSFYTAEAQLIRYDSPNAAELFGDTYMSPQTFASLLRAPQLLRRVGAQANPPLTVEALAANLRIAPERENDVVVVTLSGKSPQAAVDLANLYAGEAVRFTRELQSKSAVEVNRYVGGQLEPIQAEIAALDQRARAALRPVLPPGGLRPSPLAEKLDAARAELVDLLATYTDMHPRVREQRAKVAALEGQLALNPPANFPANAIAGDLLSSPDAIIGDRAYADGTDPNLIRTRMQALENTRLSLLSRQYGAQLFETNSAGYCQLLAAATPKGVVRHGREVKVLSLALFAGLIGVLGAAALVLLIEIMDERLKTASDVARVTRLPVLATAANLRRLSETARRRWAFRAWTSLQGRLSPSPNHGLVCGITSSDEGEGRSTWISLLAEAASQRGFRVLTIVARPSPRNGEAAADGARAQRERDGAHSGPTAPSSTTALATNVLLAPADVTEKLIGPNPQPLVNIPLPGWVWNLERRKQWQAALHHWSQIDNIAIFVELPPASVPESVLLAENLPNVVWLAQSGKAGAAQTRDQLETLRNARCRLAGAVLNYAPASFFKTRFARWFGCLALLSALEILPVAGAEPQPAVSEPAPLLANTNLSFSVVAPAQRAAWQQRLTLGPGDVLTFALYGDPTLTRTEVAVGPDGRVSFAEAQDILATGLTIDELRGKMDEELAKFRRAPQTLITPVAFRSKKYYMLGKVATKGVYILDRPLTVIEAVARAHGFESGLVDRNVIDVADFSRSFLMRRGKRIPLNFERLFQDGDLSQNLAIEPGDYLYFPSTNVKEVYVVGEVRLPGTVTYTRGLTIMGAVTSRSGYTDRAYKSHVLVVRGSINRPETYVVNTRAILNADAPDFKLQPRDIIFVNSRPFIKVEELADLAVTAFIQSLVTSWIGVDLVKPYQQ